MKKMIAALSLVMLLGASTVLNGVSGIVYAHENLEQIVQENNDINPNVGIKATKTNGFVRAAAYEVSNFSEFKDAVEEINTKPANTTYTISLKGNIDFGSSGYDCYFTKNVVMLGNGHTVDLGDKLSQGKLIVKNGATLSLGKNNATGNENKLKITAAAAKRSGSLIKIGVTGELGTLNMYEGVELTGSVTNGASLGSAVNIQNGEFNMYGGEIFGNTNEADSSLGGAVAGDGRYGKVVFNMHGGSIRDNKTPLNFPAYSGSVFLVAATFNMQGGNISGNKVELKNAGVEGYGGGVVIYGGKAVLTGGTISNNTGATSGGGIYIEGQADVTIKSGFSITGNSSSVGGGLCNNGNNVVVDSGAVIANNTASIKGDDIAHYGQSLTLAPAKDMNALLSTDSSNKPITGWYIDNPRWGQDSAQEIAVDSPLGGTEVFLKAAYKNKYRVTYRFESDSENKTLPAEVVNLIPNDTQKYNRGDKATAILPTQTSVPVANGIWEFKGYDANEKTVAGVKTEFVGKWIFKPNPINLDKSPSIHENGKTPTVGGKQNKLPETGNTSNQGFLGLIFAGSSVVLLGISGMKKNKRK